MLERDPEQRIGAMDAIQHAFIQRLTTDEMIQRYLKINKRNQRVHSDKTNSPIKQEDGEKIKVPIKDDITKKDK